MRLGLTSADGQRTASLCCGAQMSARTRTIKLLAALTVATSGAAVAGLGTFGSFTSTTSASHSVASGTVVIALGATGPANRLTVNASGLVPGDTVQRAFDLSNTGSEALASITATTTATVS